MQNTSHAVMQQRSEPKDSLDDFPTPPWATRALCAYVLSDVNLSDKTCWEPACNRGYMARPLREYFSRVYRTDVRDWDWDGQEAVCDFLIRGTEPQVLRYQLVDWIITNPPFRLAEQFVERARDEVRIGFAFIVRIAFLESVGRYRNLFSQNPPSIIAQFTERVPMVKGRYDPLATTATAYCWLVWTKGQTNTRFMWIPPCRKRLERPEDAGEV